MSIDVSAELTPSKQLQITIKSDGKSLEHIGKLEVVLDNETFVLKDTKLKVGEPTALSYATSRDKS